VCAAMFTSQHCYVHITTLPKQCKPLHRVGEALEFEREAMEHEQMLLALQQHLGVQQIAVANIDCVCWHSRPSGRVRCQLDSF
jgi:hypothetical protein